MIGPNREQLGLMQRKDALRAASEKNLDLVCVAPQANPIVCRIMDYGKYRYEQQRHAREARKNQTTVTLKEVRLSPNIEQHDFNTKLKNAQKFLEDGNKVKITVRFRGREMNYLKQGEAVLNNFITALQDIAVAEKKPILEGKNMFIILAKKI